MYKQHEKETLQRKIYEQEEYIKSLRNREFSDENRRIELTTSAYSVLYRWKDELKTLEKEGPTPLWEHLAVAALISAVISGTIYLLGAFIAWSWEFNETGGYLYRMFIGLVTIFSFGIAFKEWAKQED